MNRKAQDTEATSVRPQRVPVGARQKVVVAGKHPDYEYRIVNDYPGRIAEFQRGGWELCTNSEVSTGNFRANEASEQGSYAYIIASSLDGLKGYVMKIHKDLYAEDQERHEREVRATEETLVANTNDGEYGSVKIDRSGRR